MNNPIDHRRRHPLIPKHGAPSREQQVTGQDQRTLLIAGRDQLEELVRRFLLEGQISDRVNNDQPIPSKPEQFGGQPIGIVSLAQPLRTSHHGIEKHPMASLRRSGA